MIVSSPMIKKALARLAEQVHGYASFLLGKLLSSDDASNPTKLGHAVTR